MSSTNPQAEVYKKEEVKENPHHHRLLSFKGKDPFAHTMSLSDLGSPTLPVLYLWFLQPKDNLKEDDNPWGPWFDKCFGFVIRAKDEKSAREYADANAGYENYGGFEGNQLIRIHPWLDINYTTCTLLTGDGEEGVIIKDKRSS